MIDWLSPQILDIVWYNLASWEGVWSYWEGRFSSPLHMVVTIRSLSTCIRAQTSITSLWDSISRPYLSHIDHKHGTRVLLCEYISSRTADIAREPFHTRRYGSRTLFTSTQQRLPDDHRHPVSKCSVHVRLAPILRSHHSRSMCEHSMEQYPTAGPVESPVNAFASAHL
jgi:hypothetical protein